LRPLAYLPLAILFWVSCGKDDSAPVSFRLLPSPTGADLHAVRHGSGTGLWACGGQGDEGVVLHSADGGDHWSAMGQPFDQPLYDILFVNDTTGYASGQRAEVFKTTDGGVTWSKLWINPPAFPLEYRKPLRHIVALTDSLLFFVGGADYEAGLIARTPDAGITWSVHTFTFELRDAWFTGSDEGYACGYGSLLYTDDAGMSWQAVKAPGGYFTCLTGVGGTLWMGGFDGSIYRSVDGGAGWTPAEDPNGMLGKRNHFNELDALAGTLALCGPDGLLAFSRDGGQAWHSARSFDGTHLKGLVLTGAGNGIACGTAGSLYAFALPE